MHGTWSNPSYGVERTTAGFCRAAMAGCGCVLCPETGELILEI
ncbi:MAG: hypothetical protein R3C26_16970 [Calditrichia bacterium]